MGKQAIKEEKQIDIGLTLYTFKRSSAFQSCIVSILARLRPDNAEVSQLRKIFQQLDTSQDGVLQLEEI